MTEKIFDPSTNPDEAAQQAVIELIRASGDTLFKSKGVSHSSGIATAEFLIAFQKKLTEHYRSLE